MRRQVNAVRYSQGYLNRDKERIVRVRLAGEKAFLTIKGLTEGASRAEFEYEIPVTHAEQLLQLCDGPIIQKVRHTFVYKDLVWEVDEFLGENEGLIVAEVELEREDQSFERPSWVGQEVTEDPRYFNSNLCTNPYCKWGERQEAFGFFLYEGRERCICKASNTSQRHNLSVQLIISSRKILKFRVIFCEEKFPLSRKDCHQINQSDY